MGTIRSDIVLTDNFTNVLYNVIDSVNLGLSAMEDFQRTMNDAVDVDINIDSVNHARDAINSANAALLEFTENSGKVGSASPKVSNTPTWQTDNLKVFNTENTERFKQEIQSVNNMLNTLNSTQEKIAAAAAQTDLFPESAAADMNNMQSRLTAIQQRIKAIESNPLNINSDKANTELEQLRGQMDQAIREQEELNHAVKNMDVEAANRSYLKLSKTIGDTERYIRDNTNEQRRFNRAVKDGAEQTNKLANMIKGAAAAYTAVQIAGKIINLSDAMTQTTARLNLIVDDGGSVEDLQDKIFASAQRSRGAYMQTAEAVSKLGLLAGDAFNSNDEVIEFAEQLNKHFAIARTEASGIDAAMLQLTQAMGSGVLRGEEFNSIMEQVPTVMQAIADYMEVPKGQLKNMAAEGQITSEIVKNAMFAAADETNAEFESMPMTWSQIWTSFKSTALMAFQPVLDKINEIGNSDGFKNILNNVQNMLPIIAAVVTNIFNSLAPLGTAIVSVFQAALPAIFILLNALKAVTNALAFVGQIIVNNWSWISPIIYGVVGALGAYYTALGLLKTAQLAYNVVIGITKGIENGMIFVKGLVATATSGQTLATFAATAAQEGLNAAMYACPITWIVIAFIAWLAILYAVAAAIAHFTGAAESGFGVICSGMNVVIQFFKNLGLVIANIAVGIWNALKAVAQNMKIAFKNSISFIKSEFYGLLSTAFYVIGSIADALNKLPFVEFDSAGLTKAADGYLSKSMELKGNKEEYEDVSAAFSKGMKKYETFKDGWFTDAFKKGRDFGDGVADKVSGFFNGDLFNDILGNNEAGKAEDYTKYLKETNKLLGEGNDINSSKDIGNVGNVKNIGGDVSLSKDDIKTLRELATMEYMQNINQNNIAPVLNVKIAEVKETADIDMVIDRITRKFGEYMNISAEGVY